MVIVLLGFTTDVLSSGLVIVEDGAEDGVIEGVVDGADDRVVDLAR